MLSRPWTLGFTGIFPTFSTSVVLEVRNHRIGAFGLTSVFKISTSFQILIFANVTEIPDASVRAFPNSIEWNFIGILQKMCLNMWGVKCLWCSVYLTNNSLIIQTSMYIFICSDIKISRRSDRNQKVNEITPTSGKKVYLTLITGFTQIS